MPQTPVITDSTLSVEGWTIVNGNGCSTEEGKGTPAKRNPETDGTLPNKSEWIDRANFAVPQAPVLCAWPVKSKRKIKHIANKNEASKLANRKRSISEKQNTVRANLLRVSSFYGIILAFAGGNLLFGGIRFAFS